MRFQPQVHTNKQGPQASKRTIPPWSPHFWSIYLRSTTKPGFINDINIVWIILKSPNQRIPRHMNGQSLGWIKAGLIRNGGGRGYKDVCKGSVFNRRTSGMLCWGSEQAKQILICFLTPSYLRHISEFWDAGPDTNKQTKNIKNKFSRGQSSGASASWSVQGPGSDLSMDDKTSLGQSQLCAKASETALQSPRSTRLLMAKQGHFHDTPGCFCCDKDDP